MTRFCFLISFVVVAVLAEEKLFEYKRELIFTNRQLQQVPCRDVTLLKVVRKMVGGDTPMVKLSHMFAAPAIKIVPLQSNENYEEELQQRVDSEKELQAIITTTYDIPVREEGVVRTAMRKMGLARNVSRDAMLKMQKERQERFRIQINRIILRESTPGHVYFGNVYLMCRLKGVLRSILEPNSFVKEAEVVGDHCRLTFENGITITISGISNDNTLMDPPDYLTYIAIGNRQIQLVSCRDVRLIPVIRQLVRGDTPMLQLSCMFAAPALKSIVLENDNETGYYGKILEQIAQSQGKLENAITALLGVAVPEEEVDTSDPLKIETERRNLFRDSIKLFINAALRPGHEDHRDYNLICRLKGIYRSILHPDSIVEEAEVVGEECHLKEMNGTVHVVSIIGEAI
ncbi:uncharacterized protein LOC126834183 [Adelges cooleyi]|uniref:uncharacterized protein LOC126834183 n=1 Tax=Adelges cooleyi TaxID=133065 RepID=UPI00217F7E93|nr:uncharacterized protein LOC126834183 [Adelges cooleyi]